MILLSVLAPSLGGKVSVLNDCFVLLVIISVTGKAIVGCEVSILMVGCLLVVDISVPLSSLPVLGGVHYVVVGGVGVV